MALLEVSNIKKSFGKVEVLKGIDFALEKGSALSIIGSSGSGKTTLLRCLNFLETPEQGKIWVDNNLIFDALKVLARRDLLPTSLISKIRSFTQIIDSQSETIFIPQKHKLYYSLENIAY